MSDPVWTPALKDTEQDTFSAQLRAGLRAALPELVRQKRDDNIDYAEIAIPGLTLHLKAEQTRSIKHKKRSVFEINFRGIARSRDPETGQRTDLPIVGTCCLDIKTSAILSLIF